MNKKQALKELQQSLLFFTTSSACLSEEDSTFAPQKDVMTVAQHVTHTAHTIEWFIQPLDTGKPFDLDFESHYSSIAQVTSLKEARESLQKATDKAVAILQKNDDTFLQDPLPAGPIMGGAPRSDVITGILDHNAHHRGILTVYSRMLGKTPSMPYGEF